MISKVEVVDKYIRVCPKFLGKNYTRVLCSDFLLHFQRQYEYSVTMLAGIKRQWLEYCSFIFSHNGTPIYSPIGAKTHTHTHTHKDSLLSSISKFYNVEE